MASYRYGRTLVDMPSQADAFEKAYTYFAEAKGLGISLPEGASSIDDYIYSSYIYFILQQIIISY